MERPNGSAGATHRKRVALSARQTVIPPTLEVSALRRRPGLIEGELHEQLAGLEIAGRAEVDAFA
jgi:hypothetical protein